MLDQLNQLFPLGLGDPDPVFLSLGGGWRRCAGWFGGDALS
jgi:hypothetical protein